MAVIKQMVNTVMVKASLMLKLNGGLLSYVTTIKAVDLGKEWRNSNTIRRAEYPQNYHGNELDDDADNEDGGVVIMATMAITATVAAASSNF